MNTLQMIKNIPTIDGRNYVEWTKSFNNILQITWPFPSKIVSGYYLDLRGQNQSLERTDKGRKNADGIQMKILTVVTALRPGTQQMSIYSVCYG